MHEKPNTIYIYADGGVRNNQIKNNIGAWASVIRYNGKEKSFYQAIINTTNNKAELLSAINGLKKVSNTTIDTFVIMDSQYVIEGYNVWSKKWQTNGWLKSDNKTVENKELWIELLKEASRFERIWFVKCAGHKNEDCNNKADELCNYTMNNYEESIKYNELNL